MLKKVMWVIGMVSCLPLVTLAQSGFDFSTLRMNVVAEQKDAMLHFKEAAIGAMGGDGNEFNGFTGTSTDMGGGLLRTIIILDENVPLERAGILASFQGRLEGAVKCKRIRRGDSPDFPYGSENPHDITGRFHVLADGCSIVSVNH